MKYTKEKPIPKGYVTKKILEEENKEE